MQIRLTVLAPRSGHAVARACDVLVTAPAGTALAAVASGLASAASGAEVSGASVVLYAGGERLDAQRRVLGEPPLVDGAVLSLGAPAQDEPAHDGPAPARLHVVAGPDAGGVHLLHGGRITIGRSTESDVALDDPDVSRRHCTVTVGEDGGVSVADLDSTNGTRVDGREIGARPVRLAPGALLRIGESALRLAPGGPDTEPSLATTPDGEGHLRITPAPAAPHLGAQQAGAAAQSGARAPGDASYAFGTTPPHGASSTHGALLPSGTDSRPSSGTDPRPAPAARAASWGTGPHEDRYEEPYESAYGDRGHAPGAPRGHGYDGEDEGSEARAGRRQGTPMRGTRLPEGVPPRAPEAEDTSAEQSDAGRRRGGIGAWARRLTGGRGEPLPEPAPEEPPRRAPEPAPESWPDPAALLLTALGPGPRLWEREPGHPEALAVRVGTADRGELAAVPVTVGLREAGSLGLAGPRERLAGLARSVIAQLAALHAPATLEIVLISTDRARGLQARTAEWEWLGRLPQVRPAHGQDCRLLLAYDRDQATARTAELVRRLDAGPLGPGWASADRAAVADAAARHTGPFTVVVVDGDPGSAPLRETTARLASAGAAAGIHLLCLADTPAASPASPVDATYETACAASLAFRECGAVALLSGDVATALRLVRIAGGRPAGHGTVATVDAVSRPWAERFARALAPLRTVDGSASSAGRIASSLPATSRLLDELGLARATPASLMARWESAPDGAVVLGTGPRGPVGVDLASDGPHLLIEGPPGSGRTELLRAVAASLAAGARPDRLGMILVDGAGGDRGEGLRPCTELPHVSTHLVASDPVRMREFAQALGAELKSRAELLGGLGFAEWQSRREVAGRLVGQRQAPPAESRGDLDPPGSSTLRLRPVARSRTDEGPTLPRLVVLVDDLDALVAPALGSPGRPAAGSVVRALEAVARDGERLGVHLVAASARPDRTAETELARGARHRVVLDAPPATPSPDEPSPGRGRLHQADGVSVPFQGGRVTGRIPRTATQRPTVVVLEWERMGDPPARRPVRELGNGPTDLALLASALDRAASLVNALPVAPLT
ncbi:FtsK/SpoIIIE domain-containing protein [Streptomyces sp. NBC_00083]|uniref:FtsK/SpoIIIE domain-containing protein n=1 Tax=Streptomyces sp. NBC_00083 TaxID=2975647 RepID=UPI0022508CDC|nr:FtsK/SpoIIIE domain-containing protein [Streptomyces sp. NBC_00083]MCX5382128.1 FtsK/SpoIIIE domain-containing protein [Streptomyces sp. NBC_00083]